MLRIAVGASCLLLFDLWCHLSQSGNMYVCMYVCALKLASQFGFHLGLPDILYFILRRKFNICSLLWVATLTYLWLIFVNGNC